MLSTATKLQQETGETVYFFFFLKMSFIHDKTQTEVHTQKYIHVQKKDADMHH